MLLHIHPTDSEFHVHAESCRDNYKYGGVPYEVSASTVTLVVEWLFDYILAEQDDQTPEGLVESVSNYSTHEFRWFPCVSNLPYDREA